MEHKKLYRSEKSKILAGICGGLGEYFDIDPTILRLVWLLIVIFTGIFPGVIAYILAIFIIPLPPGAHTHENKHEKHYPDGE
ncbi:MAG: PspC domain-containing protein [Minisyncoccia bacterium]